MRIAMMTNNYKPFIGGVSISVERLAENLRRQGHQVTVFAPEYKEQTEKEEGVFRYRSFYQRKKDGAVIPNGFAPEIAEEFKKHSYDIIHVHHPMLIGNMAVYLSGHFQIPLILTYHTRYEEYLHYLGGLGPKCKPAVFAYLRYFAAHCDGIIAPTPGIAAYLEENGVHNRIKVLPTGLADESFVKVSEDSIQDAQLRRNHEPLRFITVSRLAKEKNIPFLFRCLADFKEKYGSDFRLELIGEGPLREPLRKLAIELGLEEQIQFCGKLPNQEVLEKLRASDLFLFASKTETQGIVVLEALASGLPVATLDATGTRDFIKHGINGFLSEENVSVFSSLIRLAVTEEWIKHLKSHTVVSVEKYKETRIAEETAEFYKTIIEEKRKNLCYNLYRTAHF